MISMKKIPWIRKTIKQIREDNFGYFEIQKLFETRHIDLFNFEQQQERQISYRVTE
jgi:hypothetical protein